MKPEIPAVYKNTSRFSKQSKPGIGARCVFSPSITLCPNYYAPKARKFGQAWVYPGAACSVVGTSRNVVRVRFLDGSELDFVSPEDLRPLELTSFGASIFASDSQMSNETKKIILGANLQ